MLAISVCKCSAVWRARPHPAVSLTDLDGPAALDVYVFHFGSGPMPYPEMMALAILMVLVEG